MLPILFTNSNVQFDSSVMRKCFIEEIRFGVSVIGKMDKLPSVFLVEVVEEDA
jgi:hypothetical protein